MRGTERRGSADRGSCVTGPPRRLAEADGNRTRQAEVLGFTGVEDRGDHQAPDASDGEASGAHEREVTAWSG